MKIKQIFDKLFEHYNVYTIQDLATAMSLSQSTVSQWKTRKSINAIERKCRKEGIYNEIFSDFAELDTPKASKEKTNIDKIIDRLYVHYGVHDSVTLAEKMGVSTVAISNWKSRNSINAIEKRCRQEGIYNEIFNTDKSNFSSDNLSVLFDTNTAKILKMIKIAIENDVEKEENFRKVLASFLEDNLL